MQVDASLATRAARHWCEALGVTMGQYDDLLFRNAKRINALHERINETLKERDKNEHRRRTWEKACEDFHENYPELAFPGGIETAYERIASGDPYAIEAGLSFIETRPYFFRSGYIYKDLIRKLKKAPLSNKDRERFDKVYNAYLEYRKNKDA